jgi:DNA-binding response OmpR family regulator
VLIVEGEPMISNLLCETLAEDYKVVGAATADEALAQFAEQRVDVAA